MIGGDHHGSNGVEWVKSSGASVTAKKVLDVYGGRD
jgi:hypothetical protein